MKKVYYFVLLFSFLISKAQEIPFKIQKSIVQKDKYQNSILQLSCQNANKDLVTVRSFKSGGVASDIGFYIEYYNANFELIKDFEFTLKHPLSEKNSVILGLFYTENVLQIIDIFYDLKDKAFICQSHLLSEDFKISKKELFRITKDEMHQYGSFALENLFYNQSSAWSFDNSGDISSDNQISKNNSIGSNIVMVLNEDKTVFSIAIDCNSQETEVLKIYLFDSKGNKKIDTEFIREIKDSKYQFQNLQVNPDGNSVYLLGKTYSELQKKKNVGGKYSFELTKF